MRTQCAVCKRDLVIDEPNGEAYHTDGYGKVHCTVCEHPSVKVDNPLVQPMSSDILIEETKEEKKSFWKRFLG
jgi:hypothetical protein